MAGKGMKPAQGRDLAKYRDGWDHYQRSTKRCAKKDRAITCDICGRFVSLYDLERGLAVRVLDTLDSDYSSESYETYHVKCRKAE